MKTIEVFKTNVSDQAHANNIISLLHIHYPGTKANFDLEDCDNILRIEGPSFTADKITSFLLSHGFECCILE